ncbi:class I SAM-dependent methyltransferase [Butyrivibrio fibrisolvens]|uniref:class I SAM-dependent methyltransferase n=1 Tax=Pseudobutyrivibrio ruminis TaxID=46206 RepID=UPI00047FCD5B|nr:class I SAM-dependent methyltransferase [Pseudobutyrivibrio ruminis]MDC7280108.1 class I SAM-dependent methyltransferase [Butyrivibrio fibrisolvens]
MRFNGKMDSRISRIRQNEEKSHTEVYTKEKLYDSDTWLRKPIKTVEELVPLFVHYEEVRILDLGAGVGRNSIFLAQELKENNCQIDCVDILEIAVEILVSNAEQYDVSGNISGIIKPIEEYKIQANSYDLIMAISALEHIDTEEHFFDKLREIELGIRKYGIVCLVINTEVTEFNINNVAEIEPNFEVNLATEVLLKRLDSIFKDWKILKKNVVQQNYEIPRENIRSSLSTNVVTFVARKNN